MPMRQGGEKRIKGNAIFPHVNHPGEESKYFPTWGECLDFAEANAGLGQAASVSHGEHFTGSKDMAHCLELARNGWEEGVKIAQPLSTQIMDKVTSLVQATQVTYDVEGVGLDVAAYLNGEPECWQRFEEVMQEGEGVKHVRIVMDATVSGGLSQNIMIARGAAVSALVQGLELAGCRVQLEVMPLCNGRKWESRVLVKAADQDLDMSRVVFATAHPSMLRRIGFAIQEGCPSMDKNRGYGPCDDAIDKGDIYIGRAMLGEAQWNNPESAIKWVLGKISEQGIKLAAQ